MKTIFISLAAIIAVSYAEMVTEEATMEISIGGKPIGNVKIALFGETVPKTVKNFATICNPGLQNGQSFVGSPFHRVIRNFMIQGGDVVNRDGTGSTSIYGQYFEDENFILKHTGPGFLSMANAGKDTNGCQFFVTTVPTPWLDGYHVVFGKVIDGLTTVIVIENTDTGANDKPVQPVIVDSCTVQKLEKPYDLPLN